MRQPLPLHPKQHADSPLLWLAVLSGSLLLNGALTFGLQSYLATTQPTPANATAIAINFVEAPTARATAIAPAAPRSTAPLLPPSSPSSISVTPPAVAPPRLALAPAPRSPQSTRPTPPARRPAPTASPAPQPTPLAGEPAPPPPAPTTVATSARSPSSPQTPQVATSGIQLPGFTPPPDPTQNPGDATTATTATLPLSPTAPPAKFVVQVQVLEAAGDRDSERAIVTLKSEPFTKTFSSGEAGCVLTPESLQSFNQPLQFTLTLNPIGKVTQTVPLTNSSSQRYQDLGTCVLKAWTFNPAVVASAAPPAATQFLRVKVTFTQP